MKNVDAPTEEVNYPEPYTAPRALADYGDEDSRSSVRADLVAFGIDPDESAKRLRTKLDDIIATFDQPHPDPHTGIDTWADDFGLFHP